LTSLLPEDDNSERSEDDTQEVVLNHYSSAKKLEQIDLIELLPSGRYHLTKLGNLVLRQKLLTRELKLVESDIKEELRKRKPAMRQLMKLVGGGASG